jgi:Cutinase
MLSRRPGRARRAGRAAGVTAAILVAGCSGPVAGHGRAVSAVCAPVFFGAAGSGQGPQNPAPTDLPPGVTATDARGYGTTVARLKADLTALGGRHLAATTAVDYPAVPVDEYSGPGGLTTELQVSETRGVQTLVRAIRASYRGGCDGRPVLLSGYSQGAEVIVQAVAQLTAREQAGVAVALFGNPSFRPGLTGDYPGHASGRGLRPTFLGGAYSLPVAVRARTIDICAPGDPVCGIAPGGSLVGEIAYLASHAAVHENAYAYGTENYPRTAARFLWSHRS